MNHTKRFIAHTLKVVSADSLDVRVQLDFGVSVERLVQIRDAPPADSLGEQYNWAVQCLIVLCGGKKLELDLDPSQREFRLVATVGVGALSVPSDCAMPCAGTEPVLDVGKFLIVLRDAQYNRRAVHRVLNRSSRESPDASAHAAGGDAGR